MRRFLAGLVDAVLVAVLAFIAFRLSTSAVACTNPGSCPPLTPLAVLLVMVAVVAYFGLPYLTFRQTLASRLFHLPPEEE